MRLHTPAINYRHLILLIPIITYLVYISYGLNLRDYADDRFFLSAFQQGDVVEFLKKRYMTWSGRLSIELLIVYTIGYSAFWKIGVPLAIIIGCYSSCRIVAKRVTLPLFSLSFLLYALIPLNLNIGSAWWITGFYNYLLPISIALYVFSVAYRSNNKAEKAASLALAFFFPYMEQVGLCFTIATIVMLATKAERRCNFNYLLLALVAINTGICVFAPGNFVRSLHETWSWFPQYQYYGTATKIALGLDKIHQLMTFKGNVPLIACFGMISYIGIASIPKSFAVISSSIILAIYTSLLIALGLSEHAISDSFMSGKTIFSTQWDNTAVLLSNSLMLISIVSSFTVLLSLIKHDERITISAIAMLIGYMSVMMMGFSPTVYASGMRVDYIFEFMFILSCCSLVSLLPSLSKFQSISNR